MKKITTALVAAAALLASGGAMAQAYVGGALGFSQLGGACDGVGGNCDEEDTGFKVFGGFKFNPNFAIEASYTDFGKGKVSEGPFSDSVSATAFGVGVAGFYDFTPALTGVARIGFSSNKLEAKSSGPGYSLSEDETNTKPYFGLALGYKLTRNLAIEGSVDFTNFEFYDTDTDARLFSVGVRYEF